jgi:uncharacterized membrane protein YeaQ/YmgE (transglycosylase-associated protein family)
MSLLGILLSLVVASTSAWIVDYLYPGTIPGGFLVATIVGIIGALIGGMLGHIGPAIAGISIVPCVLGCALLIAGLALVSRNFTLV